MNVKRVLLAALLIVLAISILYAVLATPRLEKAPPGTARQSDNPTAEPAGGNVAGQGPERLDLAALSREPQPFPGAKRDIFRFVQPQPKRPPAPPPKAPAPPPKVQPPRPAPLPAPQPEATIIRKELASFTFLGFLVQGGETTVFLTSEDELYLVKHGDRFGRRGQFLVEGINDSQLQVRRDGTTAPITIPLIENQKLQAAFSAPAKLPPTLPLPEESVSAPQTRPARPTQFRGDDLSTPEQVSEENNLLEGEVNGINQ